NPTIGSTGNFPLYVGSGGMSRVGDKVGIGGDPANNMALNVAGTVSTSGYVYGLNFVPILNSSTQHVYGAFIGPSVTTVANKVAVAAQIGLTDFTTASSNNSTYNLWLNEVGTLTGTMATHFGIYIEPLTKAATNWGVYVDGTEPSYFGGKIKYG